MNSRTLAYSYTRFSSLAQAGGDSIRRQTAAAKAWCEANGATLVEDFADLGVSAFKSRNATDGALAVFMRLAEGGKIPRGAFLLVESLDRITRAEITTAVSLVLRIIDAGVTVVTLADGAVYDSVSVNAEPTKLIVSITILMRAHEESLTKSKRIRAAWKAKRANAANVPITSKGPHWLRLVGGEWQVIEEKAAIVRRFFREIAEGKSITGVNRRLNDEGIPTLRKGKAWSIQTIRRIIDSRTVLGEFQPREGTATGRDAVGAPIPDYYPAIIDVATFAKVQLITAGRNRQRGGGTAPMTNAFRGLAVNPAGEPLHGQACKGRGGKYYRYLRANSTKGFSREKSVKSWNYDELKRLFAVLVERARERRPAPSGDMRAAERMGLEIEAVRAQEGNIARALSHGYLESLEAELRRLAGVREALEDRLLGAQAEPMVAPGAMIDVDDDEAIGEGARALVRRIVVDADARRFTVETLTGEIYEYREENGESAFLFPDSAIVPFPVTRVSSNKSREA